MSTTTTNGVHVAPRTAPLSAVRTDEIYRLTVAQYHDMIEHAILTTEDPVELLEGLLVRKMPKNPPHTLSLRLIRIALAALFPVGSGFFVSTQDPVTLDESEPEPDSGVVRGHERDYALRHPGPADMPLIAEVSDSTLARDRGLKKTIYAKERVPVYWIVNLVDRRIEVYTDPTGPCDEPDYRQHRDYGPGESVPVVIDGREVGQIAVNDVLP